MAPIPIGDDGYYHPATEREICDIVKLANERGMQVRVRGAAHSIAGTILTDHFSGPMTPPTEVNLMLDKYRRVTFDTPAKTVTAEAGCNLWYDPSDPTHASTLENSLFYKVREKGWSFSDMGGIIHQTVAGFLSTGSSGGSVQSSLTQHLLSIRIVDGTGTARDFSLKKDPEEFHGAVVSMGLLGVVSTVTFQCGDKFHIIGTEEIMLVEDCNFLFGKGKDGLEGFIRNTEYPRLLWWPQRRVNKVVVWQARKMQDEDYVEEVTGTKDDFRPKPYNQFPPILGSTLPAQTIIGMLYRMISDWPHKVHAEDFNGSLAEEFELLRKKAGSAFERIILPALINTFVVPGVQEFWDWWVPGIAVDYQLDDQRIPLEFSEMWIPLEQTQDVMLQLKALYAKGLAATGVLACEIYGARQRDFWMSPAYNGDVLRIDILWMRGFQADPIEFYFPQFWNLLKKFDFTLHWGKYLPRGKEWLPYLRSRYPKWNKFMALRDRMDPNQIFVTQYWREHLGILPPR